MIKCRMGNVLSEDFTRADGYRGYKSNLVNHTLPPRDINYRDHSKHIRDFTDGRYGEQTKKEFLSFLSSTEPNFRGVVHRGTKLSPEQFSTLEKLTQTGAFLASKYPMSTSKKFDMAHEFMKSSDVENHAILHIKTVGGHDISGYSSLPDEAEVILASGKHFQVLEARTVNGVYHVVLEEVAEHIAKAMKTKPNVEALSAFGLGLGLTRDNK